MATGSRSLTLKLIADIDDFNKNLNKGQNEVEGFGGKIEKFGKMAGAAFVAAGVAAAAYAGKLAIDGVKAAIEDEAAQVRLKGALEAATGATNEQIKAVEAQILKTSLATGVSDNELRPSLQRLAVSTGSVTKAQELLNLALDVSKATGKPLEAVTNALAKANDGNTTSLARLGVGLTAAELKSMSFKDAQQKLTDLWGGSASEYAQTFQGRIDRLKVGFDEAKEAVGAALLPIIEKLIAYVQDYAIPFIGKFKEGFNTVKDAIMANEDKFKSFFEVVKWAAPIIGTVLGGAFKIVAEVASNVINIIAQVLGAIKPMLNFAISGINAVIRGLNLINPFADIPYIPSVGGAGSTPTIPSLNVPSMGAGTSTSGGSAGGGTAGSSGGGGRGTTSTYVPAYAGTAGGGAMMADQLAANTINITVNGAIDPIGTAQAIYDTMSSAATTAGQFTNFGGSRAFL